MGFFSEYHMKFGRFDRLPPLGREIAVLLVLKFIALTILFVFFFGPAQRLTVSSESLQKHLLAPPENLQELTQ